MDKIFDVVISAVGDNSVQTVSARALHKYLSVGKDFSNWIKDRIDAYSFQENVDYLILTPKLAKTSGRPVTEYHVSIDMAKELSMVDRGTKGKEVRKYFLECEKTAKGLTVLSVPQTMTQALKLAYEQSVIIDSQVLTITHQKDTIESLEVLVEAQQPSVLFVEQFVKQGLNASLTKAWKGLGVAPNKFNEMLREQGVLYKLNNVNTPKQAHIVAKHFVMRYNEYSAQTLVTPRGVLYVSKRFSDFIKDNKV